MTQASELLRIAAVRLKDAAVLLAARRYDGAVYLCGYAVECALKARICRTLRWQDYPLTKGYKSFKVHNLGVLLHLTGREQIVKRNYFFEWSVVAKWDPEVRYRIGTATRTEAELMISSATTLLRKI